MEPAGTGVGKLNATGVGAGAIFWWAAEKSKGRQAEANSLWSKGLSRVRWGV